MDLDMSDADEGFVGVEVDFDYEFDAVRFFDFSLEEDAAEAREAELWFEFAGSYPPSPFIATMNAAKDAVVQNVNTLPKFKEEEDAHANTAESEFIAGAEFSEPAESCLEVHSHATSDMPKENNTVMGPFSKGSTLMKPTASQLAKQNRWREVKNAQILHRYQKSMFLKGEKSFDDPIENVCQAAKRQKLEGGHSFKVIDARQEKDLIHKISRLKLTIPREPELETAQRAQRVRIQIHKSKNADQLQNGTIPTSIFKARPLNRKILEAPSLPLHRKSKPQLPEFQEFKLKTSERAMQHSLAAPSSLIVSDYTKNSTVQHFSEGSKWSQLQDSSISQSQKNRKSNECGNAKFKARILDKKIFESKGDIGIFRSIKKETTIPKEFNFATRKRCQQIPPTDLFSKLSLNSEGQQKSAPPAIFLHTIPTMNEGSKENITEPIQQGLKREIPQKPERQCIKRESGPVSRFRIQSNSFRKSMGIR